MLNQAQAAATPGPLGTLAEFVSPFRHSTGQIIPSQTAIIDADGVVKDGHETRVKRWELQAAACNLLPGHRIQTCHKHRLPNSVTGDGTVRVYRRASASTYYRGLKVCGSVWCCPVCAAKISERRRSELAAAVDSWQTAGNTVALMTLTVRHQLETEPFRLLSGLLEAFRKFGQGKRAWTVLMKGYGGSVRALEVTHGANGWHPHLHVLVFVEGALSNPARRTLERTLLPRWSAVVERTGLGKINQHGLTLEDGNKASRYVSKWGFTVEPATSWGAVEELTKAHIKQGRKGGRTPWALLADYMTGKDDRAGALFREFVAVFKGRSQLQWSRGLRAKLGLDVEKTDEQLAHETVKAEDDLVARIHPNTWKQIRRLELRGWVLELLRTGTWDDVEQLLDFRCNPSAHKNVPPDRAN